MFTVEQASKGMVKGGEGVDEECRTATPPCLSMLVIVDATPLPLLLSVAGKKVFDVGLKVQAYGLSSDNFKGVTLVEPNDVTPPFLLLFTVDDGVIDIPAV